MSIPDSVTSIGKIAFSYCDSLTSISVDNGNTAYTSENGVLFDKTKTTLITYPGGKSGDYSIPDSVTSIGDSAFSLCDSLTSVSISDSVTSIGEWAFSGCTGLTSVSIPSSVTSIGDYAFHDCTGLTSVSIPDSVTSIGEWVFAYYNNLTIYGTAGSYAESYAEENDIPFVAGSMPIYEDTPDIEILSWDGTDVAITSKNAVSGAQLIMASYIDDKLINSKLQECSLAEGDNSITMEFDAKGSNVRIFLWDKLNNLQPLCDYYDAP